MLDAQRERILSGLLSELGPAVDACTPDTLVQARAVRLYWQARALSVKAVTFQSDPLGPLLQLEALSAARCAAEVLL
ncbi:hypothetical protein B5M06_13415 [Comamonas kerstersii]|uniref:Uncharacterized protein n=1 Tax=Comamonas kerstersii TaxID=225992 RepID=A0A1V0BGP3_9BURK|nr:hypothetical protein [Comamonas kerstersii]AQZ99106.1 hypothetical protein B5M06_13415 [Comamonas kerstersii]